MLEARGPEVCDLLANYKPGQNPRYAATTLSEYRSHYPSTAPVPTLTQMGMLGPLLERHDYKIWQGLRRRATREKMWSIAVDVLAWLRDGFSAAPSHRRDGPAVEPSAGRV